MKKAIVTGSNGFVGSNVCKRLCADGVKVYAVVKDKNEKINNIEKLDGIEIVYCELDEIETLFDKISDRDVDVFYHFAGRLGRPVKMRREHSVAECALDSPCAQNS